MWSTKNIWFSRLDILLKRDYISVLKFIFAQTFVSHTDSNALFSLKKKNYNKIILMKDANVQTVHFIIKNNNNK